MYRSPYYTGNRITNHDFDNSPHNMKVQRIGFGGSRFTRLNDLNSVLGGILTSRYAGRYC